MNTRPNWIVMVGGSIPKYAEDLAANLTLVMSSDNGLDEIDAHACALAAAIVSNNAGFADEIAMNGPLFKTTEREAAKTAAFLVTCDDLCSNFRACSNHTGQSNLSEVGADNFGGVSPLKYNMYALAAAVALKIDVNIIKYVLYLRGCDATDRQIQAIGEIAAVISTFTKIMA